MIALSPKTYPARALRQQGGGTLTLTGDYTFSGSTTVSSSTLKISYDGSSGTLAGDLINSVC